MSGSSCIGLFLTVFVIAGPCRAVAGEPEDHVACVRLPSNVEIPTDLRLALTDLLAQSSTLQRQCARLTAAATSAHILVIPMRPAAAAVRARTAFARSAAGHLNARIEVPFNRDFPELIAHELEHVIEQIEGLDLADLSRQPSSGVDQLTAGVFETARARAAGRAAALEIARAVQRAGAGVPALGAKNARTEPATLKTPDFLD